MGHAGSTVDRHGGSLDAAHSNQALASAFAVVDATIAAAAAAAAVAAAATTMHCSFCSLA